MALFALLPLFIVLVASGPARSAYAVKVELVEHLAATQGGELQFLLVRAVAGRAPADRFVITLDQGYTAGAARVVQPGDVFAVEGTLMDRETYFGPQYLFFGYPQLYVSQVKSGLFWPSQVSDISGLYFSPVSSVLAPYVVVVLPFMEEFTLGAWFAILARAAIAVAALVLVVRWRRLPVRIAEVLSAYMVLAVLVATPGLGG